MLEAQNLTDDELLDTMNALQGEFDRRSRIEDLQKHIKTLTQELNKAKADLQALLDTEPVTSEKTDALAGLDLSLAEDWQEGKQYNSGDLAVYRGATYQALEDSVYSPLAHPQAWKKVE